MSKELDYIADLERKNRTLKSILYCTKRSCNNCGKVNCENFQRQRIDCCGLWVSYKDYIKQQEEQIKSQKKEITQAHIDGHNRGYAKAKEELEQENNKLLDVINNQDVKIADLEQENAILEKALSLYVNWADECGIAWDNFPDMTDKWYKKVEEKNLGWIAGLIFMVKEEAKEQLEKECENGK